MLPNEFNQLRRLLISLSLMLVFIGITLPLMFYLAFLLPSPPVDYQLPKIAKIVEQEASPADFHGDYSYSGIFLLPSPEIKNLVAKGFDWITFDFPIEDKPRWKTGKLTTEIFEQVMQTNSLKDRLDPQKVYKYLYIGGSGGYRLFAIDESKNKVYYFRYSS
jgi:hypothetical protein